MLGDSRAVVLRNTGEADSTPGLPEPSPGGSEPLPDMPEPKCLLSLDGGGVKGLSSLKILESIMNQVNHHRRRQRHDSLDLKPCDIFDLIGGTSTGGLIAIMLGRLEMDVDSCIRAYQKFTPLVFEKQKTHFPFSLMGHIEPRYDSDKLREFILNTVKAREGKDNSGNTLDPALVPLRKEGRDPDCRVFVCALAAENRQISLLTTYTPIYKTLATPMIVDAALATTAATTYFEQAKIPTGDNQNRHFWDGAIGANNPVNKVVKEARNVWLGDPSSTVRSEDFVHCLVSLGTGLPLQKEVGKTVWKFVETLKDIATDTERTAATFHEGWTGPTGEDATYYRFNLPGLEFVRLDSPNSEGTIDAATETYVNNKEVGSKIYNCAKILARKPLNPTGIVSLIEAGREYLANGKPSRAFDKFCEAAKLVHRHNPDRLELARFVAASLGMAECLIKMAEYTCKEVEADFHGALAQDDDVLQVDADQMLGEALKQIKGVKDAEQKWKGDIGQSSTDSIDQLERRIERLKSSIGNKAREIGMAR